MKTGSVIWSAVLFVSSVVANAQSDMGAQIDELAKTLLNAKQAEVVKGSESEVYISLGQKHGVVPGNRFEVVRLGEELKLGDEVIGHEETQIATIEIEKARDGYSIAKVLESSGIPKAGDRAFESRKKVKRLAVGQFTFNQGVNRMTKSLQEKLFLSMTNQGLEVVERDQLEKVLAEQKMGYSGLVNIDSAKKIGELLGAEAMVLGTISDLGNSISINARMVDLEAGNSISAAEMELAKTPLISQLLGMELKIKRISAPEKNSSMVSTGVTSANTDTPQSFGAAYQNSFILVRPINITKTRKGNGILLSLDIQNKLADKIYIGSGTARGTSGYPKASLTGNKGTNIRDRNIEMTGLRMTYSVEKLKKYTPIEGKSRAAVNLVFSANDEDEIDDTSFNLIMEMFRHSGKGKEWSRFTMSIPNIRIQ